MLIRRLIFLEIIILIIFIKNIYCLRCRADDGPSDRELKRVARSCMRKFGDEAFAQNSQQQQQMEYHQHQQYQPTQGRPTKTNNKQNYGYNYEDSEESAASDNFEDDQYQYKNYNNNRNNHKQNGNGNNNNERAGHADHTDDSQRNRSRYNGISQNRTINGSNNNNWNYLNQRNNRGNNNNNNNNNNKNKNNNNYQNQNNSFSDAACIVHCFFNEMNMLNNNDYPDRHKMLYVLTKGLRDHELRNFYADTIQECFRYIENQRRRDKCQFSRDLITCMTEYAKGNCEDWNEFNMVFN